MNNHIKKIAITAAKKAGKFLLKEYERFDRSTVQLKSHHEILTKADLISEEIIIKEINSNFPTHEILSEERGRVGQAGEYLWIIDPLDGSTNFSMHNPLWSISLAVARTLPQPSPSQGEGEHELILGLVFAPVLDELYLAELDNGAKLNGRTIAASNIREGKVLNTFCHGREKVHIKKAIAYYSKQKLNQLDCRQLGSAAIELAYVASGRVESFAAPGINSWDVAAGALLVREAGGRVTDFNGKQWYLDSIDMLASNGKVHKELLKVINKR